MKKMNLIKFTILSLIFTLNLIIANAQITQPTAWTKAYDQVSGTCNTVSFPVAAGSNRILVVGITNTFTASAVQANPTTISYGGVTLTLATTNGATSGRMHTWLYYLKDNAVMDASSRPLNVTLAGTHANVTVWYSVFAGVDQVAAITTGNGFNNTAGSGPAQLSAAMAVNANQQAVYISSMYSANTTVPAYTINANWTTGGNNSGNNGTISWKNEPTKRIIPGANTTDDAVTSAITPAANVRWAMSAMSLPMAVAATPTLTISNPTTSVGAASLCGSATKVPIHAFNIACSGGASTLTNFQFTTTGTYVAADLTNYKIWWNSSNSLATATLLATNATPGGPGLKTFTAFSLNIPNTTTYYFWITADISATPVSGHALTVSSSVSTDMTTTATKAGGPTAASGTQTVNSLPSTPGVITGPASVGAATAGLNYSIAAVVGATTYNWSVPAGWSVTSGAGTVAVVVTSGAIGQNGSISVTATNGCGTSAASNLAVSVAAPHDVCNDCHINHNTLGMQLTTVNGNANLCMSCHNPTGTASTMPFTNLMSAIPGTSGTSHAWNKPTVNATYQSNAPTNPGMVARVYSNQIVCSTCHDQHTSNVNPNFLRIANTEDALCLQCHVARDLRRYLDNTATNKKTHPVGITYSLADSRFQAMGLPLSASSKVVCSTCHDTHASSSSDGNILRNASKDNLCATCHTYLGFDITLNHKGMTCTTCHYGHNAGSANIYLINDNIITPNSGTKAAVFTTNASGSNFADGTGTINGVCEVCHTLTDHFTNTAMGTVDARHIVSPVVKCTTCHPHNKAFAAQTDCLGCHNTVQDKPGVGPVGGRRAVVGASGDFVRTSHHSNTAPIVADCIKCHYMGDHKDGLIKLLDPDLGYANVFTYDPLNKSSVESFCLKCHDANGSNGDVTPFSDGVTVPAVDATMWAASSHKGAASTSTCLNCHDNGHGSNKRNLLGPATYAGPGTGTDLMNEEEGLCLTCHGAAGLATVKVHLAFSTYTNTALNFFKHDPAATYRKHVSGETGGASFTGANRHVECVDCHNPHGAKAGTAVAPAMLPTLIGATGVQPIYGVSNTSPGAPTGFTWQSVITQEYQVCFKCHSSYTTLPTYLPGGYQNAAAIADGLKKLTTGGTSNQIADNRDMAQEYNPNNASYHPILAAGKNLNINATAFQAGWSYTSRMYCSDCHGNTAAATAGHGNGPHGSANLHLLDNGIGGAAQYPTYHSTNPSANIVCTKCHVSGRTNTGSRFGYHNYHLSKAACYDCHDSHGSEVNHNWNFSRNVPSCITAFGASPYHTSQSAFVHAAGTATNACVVTCHGTGHSTGSKTYNPSYN